MLYLNKKQILTGIACLLTIAALAMYFYFHVDMTGRPYGEIEAYRAQYPNKIVSYTVTLAGDSTVKLNERSVSVTGLTASHVTSLLEQQEYLQGLTAVDFTNAVLPAETVLQLQEAFPRASVTFGSVSFLGKAYPYDTTAVDLSHITSKDIAAAAHLLNALPMADSAELCSGSQCSTLSPEDANRLYTLCPDVIYNYRTELFGQTISTDMETVEYFKVDIGDEGLEQFKLLLPMMHKLTYFKLDWCKTSDEAMDALRTQYKDRFKVVWRIFFGYSYNALTDTYKLWANEGLNDKNTQSVKYCNEVRYLDFGHSKISHCEWVRYMPDLEVCILSDSNLKSLEPLTACPKLEFLEFFFTFVTDLTPCAEMENLQYLNVSRLKWSVTDISPLYELKNLKHFHAALTSSIPKDQVKTFKQLHPDCYVYYSLDGDSTGQRWRRFRSGHYTPRYKLLRAQIGYDTEDVSRYPTGYSREIISYETTGITPP